VVRVIDEEIRVQLRVDHDPVDEVVHDRRNAVDPAQALVPSS
jgi:hypothetical protein